MALLRTVHGQRSASGFDFWYEGEYEGHKLIVSPTVKHELPDHTVEAAVEHIKQGRPGAWFEDKVFDASLRGSDADTKGV